MEKQFTAQSQNNNTTSHHVFAGGEVSVWIEQGTSIQLKAVSSHGDPVELTAEQALEVAAKMKELADMIETVDTEGE